MGRLKSLITIIVVAAAIYTSYKVVPVFYNNYSFQNELENTVLVESYVSRPERQIQELVAAKAAALNIPISPEEVVVRRDGMQLTISTEYSVHIDIPIWPFDLKFSPSTQNRRI